MKKKSFLFVASWLEPMKVLTPEQRWSIIEAVSMYATTGTKPGEMSAIERVVFAFICNDVDEMSNKYQDICEKRRKAAQARWGREDGVVKGEGSRVNEEKSREKDADASDAMQTTINKKANKQKNKESNKQESKKAENKTSTTTSCAYVREEGAAPTSYTDHQLVDHFFDTRNLAKLEALAMRLQTDIKSLRQMAVEIVDQWALTGKTHTDYQDASTHLVYVLEGKTAKIRRQKLSEYTGTGPASEEYRGVLGVGEYRDSKGRRTYNGIDTVPDDAPPRPGKAYWWSKTTEQWEDCV